MFYSYYNVMSIISINGFAQMYWGRNPEAKLPGSEMTSMPFEGDGTVPAMKVLLGVAQGCSSPKPVRMIPLSSGCRS